MGREQIDLLADDFYEMSRELRGMERDVLPAVVREMTFQTKRNLIESTDAFGKPFEPLKDGSGRKPLLKTLRLFQAIRGYVSGNAAVVECVVDYARIQNQGGTIVKGEQRRTGAEKPWVFVVNGRTIFTRRIRPHKTTIPARRFMGTGRRMIEACVKVVLDFSDKVFERRR